ncbi:hypothetical protein DPMN_095624 [Dreissena polymorpha]|uniref:Uncharacterized protein n=1 Tax=Dreissena polymorpha TaxID=45954 RepID=A0A9D4L7S0_DREPO|nr:hypothetical protein DPMN_095624 [Dreissena polymorpha]
MEDKLLGLETNSMSHNLVFYGVPEPISADPKECTKAISDIIHTVLEKHDDMKPDFAYCQASRGTAQGK